MKMSKETYDLFTDFYNATVEGAGDEEVLYVLKTLDNAFKRKINDYSNNRLDKRNADLIRDFFEDFLANANDNDAIYLIEVIKSACKKLKEDPKGVAKFVEEKKKEAAKNAEKN